ncbi:dihydrodipicolinate synthase family protein [Treponema sp. OttesenSCG-928-L16]|nr:dihydrodipicolinate synthase family protein [Treponema sp. OttesenSCG-928-L16]
MGYDKTIERLEGIIPFIPTPFVQNGNLFTAISEEGLRRNLRFLEQFSFSCISPAAGTGDLMTLDDNEYQTVLKISMEEAGKRFLLLPGLPQETERAMRMARYAQSIGYECLLSFPGPSLNLSEPGLICHWRSIASCVTIPIIIFRAPWLPFSMNVLEALSDVGNIIGVKEETGDLLWFRTARARYNERYVFIGGGELQFVNYLLAGARAITTGLPNFMPKPFFDIFNYAREDKYAEANKLHESLFPLLSIRQKQGNPIPVLKYAMDSVGLCGGANRLPQVDLCPEDKLAVDRILVEFKEAGYLQ